MPTITPLEPFDPNDGAPDGAVAWPVYKQALNADQYAMNMMEPIPSTQEMFAKAITDAVQKGTQLPPQMQSFATISLMPEVHNGGVLQVPGIPPEALRKIVRTNIGPQLIIMQRVADVQSYSQLSTHPWKPGWKIELTKALKTPSAQDLQDIADAECFLSNCNSEYGWNANERDQAQLSSFSSFLTQITIDTLTYDSIAVWKDVDLKGRVKGFKALSGFNIRFATAEGYQGNPDNFAVAVDEAGTIIKVFTREELTYVTRNSRADADIGPYGYSEIEQAIRAIQGAQNTLDTAVDTFNRNAVPNGLLTATGLFSQRQLDLLGRVFNNLKKGVTKQWALPVIPLPKDAKLDLMNLTALNGEDMRNQDLFNVMWGILCTIYKFPIERLGYRASGKGPDSEMNQNNNVGPNHSIDVGLEPLLNTYENVINQYILRTRWPHLQFCFTGKNPAADAREYEARALAMTWGERRKAADMQPLEALATSEEEKKIARLMSLAPSDPTLSGIFQNIASAVMGIGKEGKSPETMFPSKKDPAQALAHGHQAGVRRDSAAEEKSAAK